MQDEEGSAFRSAKHCTSTTDHQLFAAVTLDGIHIELLLAR
jgi:hypothetical protein